MAIVKGDNKDNVVLGDIENDTLYGYLGNDTLFGNLGDDNLVGGLGDDSLVGNEGDDVYIVNSFGDSILEQSDGGVDTVISSVDWTLGGNIENLLLTEQVAAVKGIGNPLNNFIAGNHFANRLIGLNGDDILDARTGVDSLFGGGGNDVLKVEDVNGDVINGGIGKQDALWVYGSDQQLDLTAKNTIKDIEAITFSGTGHNVLTLSAQSVIDLSANSNTLVVNGDSGDTLYLDNPDWQFRGIQDGYQVFKLGEATVKANAAITDIVLDFTISDAATAGQVGDFFTPEAQRIIIDFGGKQYGYAGVPVIDLTGFGLEDTLAIAAHDGIIGDENADYHIDGENRPNYISQYTATYFTLSSYSGGRVSNDRVSWGKGANTAKLLSSMYTVRSFISTFGSIKIIGLPTGLPDNQFVFV